MIGNIFVPLGQVAIIFIGVTAGGYLSGFSLGVIITLITLAAGATIFRYTNWSKPEAGLSRLFTIFLWLLGFAIGNTAGWEKIPWIVWFL